MIHWCSYCQRLIGELPPLTSYEVSHGICRNCVVRLEAGEPLVAEYKEVVRFFRELFAAGNASDLHAGARLIERAQARGYGQAELLVGLAEAHAFKTSSRLVYAKEETAQKKGEPLRDPKRSRWETFIADRLVPLAGPLSNGLVLVGMVATVVAGILVIRSSG